MATTTVTIKNIDPELFKEVKAKANLEDLKLKDLLHVFFNNGMKEWLKKQ